MRDFIYIGSSPIDEDCAQIGITEGASRLNLIECDAYLQALRMVYGPEPIGAELRIKTEHHDFGAYREVVCYYETDNDTATEYAFKIESGLLTWAEAGMTAPVRYDENCQALGALADA